LPPRSDRPNVVVFFTDQQRFDTAGIHGNPMGLTPNFDRMATEGTHAFHAFTSQPVCLPARACFQTGLYATQAQCHTNNCTLPTELPTLANYFNDAGYRTGYIGKWHLFGTGELIVPQAHRGGYQDWLASNVLEFTSDAYHCVMYDEDDRPVKLPGYRVDAQTDAAIRYIDRHQAEPFFLFCSYIEPHFQNTRDDYPAPDGYAERYLDPWTPPDLRALVGTSPQHLPGYYGMVKRLDEALGRVLDALKSLELRDNTIVLFTTDHGNHFKTRNGEYKRSAHDASIRIPTALCGPGFEGGGRLQELVSLVDLPPTLLDACGLPVPAQMVGRSLLPLTRGERQWWPEEVFVQISESQVGRAVRTKRWKYSVMAPDAQGWRDPGADHYVEECLYDLYADPYELTNLAGLTSHRAVADVMRERLLRRMAAAGEAVPTIAAAPERPGGQKTLSEREIRQ
jgi:arylsulfatase A-like enzyme